MDNVWRRGVTEDLSFAFILFACGGLLDLFVLDSSNAFGEVLVMLHTNTSLSEFGLVAVRQKLQMLSFRPTLLGGVGWEGGSSVVTSCSSPKKGYFCGFGNNSEQLSLVYRDTKYSHKTITDTPM